MAETLAGNLAEVSGDGMCLGKGSPPSSRDDAEAAQNPAGFYATVTSGNAWLRIRSMVGGCDRFGVSWWVVQDAAERVHITAAIPTLSHQDAQAGRLESRPRNRVRGRWTIGPPWSGASWPPRCGVCRELCRSDIRSILTVLGMTSWDWRRPVPLSERLSRGRCPSHPCRSPRVLPSGSWNQAPRAGPTWAMWPVVVRGPSE